MIYPNKLVSNDFIEIISPSNGIKSKKINVYEQALDNLRSFGFNIIEDSYVRNSINGVSSNALNRANECYSSDRKDQIYLFITILLK